MCTVSLLVFLQVMTLSNGEQLVMSEKDLKLVLESGSLMEAAPPTLASCVSGTVCACSTHHVVIVV